MNVFVGGCAEQTGIFDLKLYSARILHNWLIVTFHIPFVVNLYFGKLGAVFDVTHIKRSTV